ncbi:hypothetical protein [Deinococcus roseus]|uniref:Uncharacterized protein n=1 Tax=Deinococcus roseus TaxID=392414 RepID=A0ABQ2D5N5_9DEIO|nr:hypothetical protein [Deinococcus roseus]GGJ43905.1 hypothetical protein GCM10008938_32710 [Deinococcus roseus]
MLNQMKRFHGHPPPSIPRQVWWEAETHGFWASALLAGILFSAHTNQIGHLPLKDTYVDFLTFIPYALLIVLAFGFGFLPFFVHLLLAFTVGRILQKAPLAPLPETLVHLTVGGHLGLWFDPLASPAESLFAGASCTVTCLLTAHLRYGKNSGN